MHAFLSAFQHSWRVQHVQIMLLIILLRRCFLACSIVDAIQIVQPVQISYHETGHFRIQRFRIKPSDFKIRSEKKNLGWMVQKSES